MSANLKITMLVDDLAGEGLSAEHGLSLWIDTGTERILFDTGQPAALGENARRLRIGLDQASILILSHGHYDHTGGIPQVLKHVRETNVYCHPGVVQLRYSIRDGRPKPIQMPRESIAAIDELPARSIHWTSQALLLSERIGITGPIPRETSYEDTGGPFYLDPQGWRTDPVDDDLALWIRTADGLAVCVGCCHAGLVNTLNHACHLTKQDRIRAVIGGFHLLNANDQRLELTTAALRSFSPSMVVPCHRTGERAIKVLKATLGERVAPSYAGASYGF
jgi:7,8-dihydropterin-6-yl-methyl-4-(beta-D-ribofuranosyl)aminobenzene 5'-phosphate synthase